MLPNLFDISIFETQNMSVREFALADGKKLVRIIKKEIIRTVGVLETFCGFDVAGLVFIHKANKFWDLMNFGKFSIKPIFIRFKARISQVFLI